MRRLMMMAAAVASLITGAASAAEDRRVALIIGNDSYRSLKKLDNGANDARAMASELKAMGFETILKVNAGRKEMHAAIGEFGGKLSSGAVGLFYYAGHGIQAGDHNYLVPVDAELVSEDDLVADAI
ncbi:MAG: caspase family protein, partial [Magnetospirillum sp.]|nr:caspase family protein [Magnetospirillum sp.]